MASSLRSRSRRSAMADINVVPYIDVMLVLLVIFMVTAPLVAPSVINLPSVAKVSAQQTLPPIVINIQADGALSIKYQDKQQTQTTTITKQSLIAFITARQTNLEQPVVIAADKEVRYAQVMEIMSLLKEQGFKRVGLLVNSVS